MLATDASPLMTVPSSSSSASTSSPPASPSPVGSETDTSVLTVMSTKGTLTWMRQLALVVVYYLVFKAAATNPIAANLREHLRAKLLSPSQRGVGETLRGFFRR